MRRAVGGGPGVIVMIMKKLKCEKYAKNDKCEEADEH